MSEIVKDVITPKWLKIKKMYKEGTNGSKKYGTNFELGGELNVLALELIDMLGEITQKNGFDCIVEDIEMDLWKKRVWSLIENAGLLNAIETDDDEDDDGDDEEDDWFIKEEENVDLDKMAKEKYGF
jgi:hypothetical protein